MNAKDIINQLASELVWKERNDKTKFVCRNITGDFIQDIIHEVHEDRMPDDTIYEFIYKVVNHLADCDSEDIEDMRDELREIEADVYTSDLTEWLHKSNYHVYYLTQALEEFEPKDGFSLLTIAQSLHIQEVGDNLLNAIEKHLETVEVA